MRNKLTQTFLKALSEEYELPIEVIEEIVKSPYLFHVDVMKHRCIREEGIFPATRIEGFGIFYSPEWKKEKMKKLTLKLKDKPTNDTSISDNS